MASDVSAVAGSSVTPNCYAGIDADGASIHATGAPTSYNDGSCDGFSVAGSKSSAGDMIEGGSNETVSDDPLRTIVQEQEENGDAFMM